MTGASSGVGELPADRIQEAAGLFGMLASALRLHIVWVLSHGECDVGSLAEQVGAPMPTVSQHLAKLKLAGLVRSRQQGRRRVYVVDDPNLVSVVRLMFEHLAAEGGGAGSGARHGLGA